MNFTTLSNSDLSLSVGFVLCMYNASDNFRCCVFLLTQIGPRGGIPPLDISGCLTTLVSLRHVIWISHSSVSFGEAIRHKIYGIQGLFFRKLGFENA